MSMSHMVLRVMVVCANNINQEEDKLTRVHGLSFKHMQSHESRSKTPQMTIKRKKKEGSENPPHASASHSRFAVQTDLCASDAADARFKPNFKYPRNGKRKIP